MKNVFLSQYLFIAILCAKLSSVYRALEYGKNNVAAIARKYLNTPYIFEQSYRTHIAECVTDLD
jgi:hypothetical protein